MIGSGSYANVYRYIDPEYGIPVTLKRAKRDLDPRDLKRFRNEFDLLKDLSFPYILQVFRYNEERNDYTMEHCHATLRDFIDTNNVHMAFGTRKRVALQFLHRGDETSSFERGLLGLSGERALTTVCIRSGSGRG